jgi:putative flippase GtrA
LDKDTVVDALHKQALVFSIVGFVCFIVDAGFLTVFISGLSLSVIPATIFAFIIANIVNYLLSVRFIFVNGKFSLHGEIGGFFLISVIGLGLNVLFMHLFSNFLGIWYLWAKILTALLVMSFNFTTKKWFLFVR